MSRLYNSTITTKKQQLKCGCFDYNFSRGRCKKHAILENMLKKDLDESSQEEDLKGLIEDADTLVSKFIRLSAMRDNLIECYTCGGKHSYGETDCGHYIPRANMYLRFDQRNLKPQCHKCNRVKYGMAAVFARKLDEEFPGLPDILLEESRLIHKSTREELRAIISDMTDKISKLKK